MIIRNFALTVKAIIVKDNKFLLLHKSSDEMKKTKINKYNPWDLPGGSIQFFEKSIDGLHREVKEETGLDIKIIKPIGIYDAIKPHLHMTILTFLCEYKKGIVSLSREHDSYTWLTEESLNDIDIPTWLKKYFYTAINEYNN